jgi:hypothetical protein
MKIQNKRPDDKSISTDVFARENTAREILEFDGVHLRFEDRSYGLIMISDVFHSTTTTP